MIALMLIDWLAELGFETVGPISTVAAATAAASSEAVDAAILDLTLADGNSTPAAAELKRRAVPFVFATGHGAEAVAADFDNAPTIAKPYDFGDVESALTSLLAPAI